MRRPTGRVWIALAMVLGAGAAAAGTAWLGGRDPVERAGPGGPVPPRACAAPGRGFAAGTVTRLRPTVPAYRVDRVADGRVFDLRGTRVVGFPAVTRYPLLLGKRGPGRACVLGGTVVGRQPRGLDWQAMKRRLDGDGLNFRSAGGVVDGIRVDNLEDGIGVVGGDPAGVSVRNAYLSYIRDDCIENDAIVGLTVSDSLLDGCYAGISERPDRHATPRPAPPEETLTLDGVLLRLQPMPFDRAEATCGASAADGLGHSGFFKWSRFANRLVVRNTVLLAERDSVNCASSLDLPGNGSSYEGVTLVWLGPGRYPGRLPGNGVTVTRDRSVWDRARAEWLARHGYPAVPSPSN